MKRILYIVTVLSVWTGSVWGQSPTCTGEPPKCYGENGKITITNIPTTGFWPQTTYCIVSGGALGTPGQQYNIDPTGTNVIEVVAHLATYSISFYRAGGQTNGTVSNIRVPVVTLLEFEEPDFYTDCFTGEGIIVLSLQGGTPKYTYRVEGPNSYFFEDITENITKQLIVEELGIYSVYITDKNECEIFERDIEIVEYDWFTDLTLTPYDADCHGASTGSLKIEITGGNGPFTYSVNDETLYDVSPIPDLPASASGSYHTVDIIDSEGCYITRTFEIGQPGPVIVILPSTIDEIQCFGEDDVVVILTATSDSPTSKYKFYMEDQGWTSIFEANHTFTISEAGTYEVKAKDEDGCESTTPVFVEIIGPTEALSITDVEQTPLSCDAAMSSPDGKITVTARGGTPKYTYKIDGPNLPGGYPKTSSPTEQGTYTFENLPVGTYAITVVDANGCDKTETESVTAVAAITASISHDPDPVTCAGNVTITVENISGVSTRALEYNFNNSANWTPLTGTEFEQTVNESGENDYNVKIRYKEDPYKSKCPVFNRDYTVDIPEPIKFTLASDPVSCYGGRNGTITIEAEGGSEKYVYSITSSNPILLPPILTGNEYSRLPAGEYTITVKDEDDLTCEGVLVDEDDNIITTGNTIMVTQPAPIQVTNVETTKASCSGSENGTITLTVVGGTAPSYTYLLNGVSAVYTGDNNNPTFTVENGTYNITIRDDHYSTLLTPAVNLNGCQIIKTGVIVEVADPIVLEVPPIDANYDPVTCNDLAGYITLTLNVDTYEDNYEDLVYEYKIDGGASWLTNTNNTFNNLGIGGTTSTSTKYILMARYANDTDVDCAASDEYTITIPAPIIFGLVTTDPLCNVADDDLDTGIGTGTITVTASGGYAGSVFKFSKDGTTWVTGSEAANIHKFVGLDPGQYTIQVKKVYTDSESVEHACPAEQKIEHTVTLANPPALKFASKVEVTNVTCPDASVKDGTITASAAGGTAPYTYFLNGTLDATPPFGEFSDLNNGSYTVLIEDSKGCQKDTVVEIRRQEPIVFTVTAGKEMQLCETNATLTLNVTSPSPFVSNTLTYRLTKDGGTSSAWSGFGDTTPKIVKVDDDAEYEVEIAYIGGENCPNIATETAVQVPEIPDPITISGVMPNKCGGAAKGELIIHSILPIGTAFQLLYSKNGIDGWEINTPFTSTATNMPRTFENLRGGFYKVQGTISGGSCPPFESEVVPLIDLYDVIRVTILSVASPCNEDEKNGEITITVTGGYETGGYRFELHTKNPCDDCGFSERKANNDGIFTGLELENYYIYVKDTYGCNTGFIPPNGLSNIYKYPAELKFNEKDDEINHVTCKDDFGSAIIDIQGGRIHYTYGWVNGKFEVNDSTRLNYTYDWERLNSSDNWEPWNDKTDLMANNMTAGEYRITVTDDCNTTISKMVTIEDNSLAMVAEFQGGVSCEGEPEGSITVTVTGGIPNTSGQRYVYTVTKTGEPAFDPDSYTTNVSIDPEDEDTEVYVISGLEDGEYTIEVTDASPSCSVSETDDIENPIALGVKAHKENVKCNNDNDGSIRIAFIGGVAPFTIKLVDNNNVVLADDDGEECILEGIDEHNLNSTTNITISLSNGPVGDSIVVIFNKLPGGASTGSQTNRTKTYTAVVEEERENGCSWTGNFGIVNPRTLTVSLNTVDEDGVLYNKNFVCPNSNSDIYLAYTPLNGQGTTTGEFWVYNGTDYDVDEHFSYSDPVQPGKYYVIAEDDYCRSAPSNIITIYEYKELTINTNNVTTVDETCSEGGKILITGLVGGKTSVDADEDVGNVFEYKVYDVKDDSKPIKTVTGGNNDVTIEDIPAGEYYVIVKFNQTPDDCSVIAEYEIPIHIVVDKEISFDISDFVINTTDPTCFNFAEGVIEIASYNAVLPGEGFDYKLNKLNWETLPVLPWEIPDLLMGEYTLYIKDVESSCVDSVKISLGENLTKVNIRNVSSYNPNCGSTYGGYIEFEVELISSTITNNDLTVTCTNTDNDPVIEAEIVAGKKWKYRAYMKDEEEEITIGVSFFDGYSCGVDTTIYNVEYPAVITLSHTKENAVSCESQSIHVKFAIEGGLGPYKLYGIPGDPVSVTASGEITYYEVDLPADNYSVTVEDENGCFSDPSDDFEIELPKAIILGDLDANPPIMPYDVENVRCPGEMNGNIDLNPPEPNDYTYLWSGKDLDGGDIEILPRNNGKPSLDYVGQGTYTVVITNTAGCPPLTVIIPVGVKNDVDINITPSKNLYCPDEKVKLFGTILPNNPADINGFSGIWKLPSSPDVTWTDANDPFEYDATDKTVKLEVTISLLAGGNPCVFKKEYTATLGAPPYFNFAGDFMYIPRDGEGELIINKDWEWNDINYTYKWQTIPPNHAADLADPKDPVILNFPSSDTYQLILTLIDESSCSVSDTVSVERALDIVPTNVFTPNGDGKNDVWKFRNIEYYTAFYRIQVVVFNRGGSVLFSSKDYNNENAAWDGTRSGQHVPAGNYPYVVEIFYRSSGKKYKDLTGSVTIMR